jgi:hypothetical protein
VKVEIGKEFFEHSLSSADALCYLHEVAAMATYTANGRSSATKGAALRVDGCESDSMSTNLMKALRFAEFGPPSMLRVEEVPIPEPGEGEALVRVKAAAINPSDIGNVAGHFQKTTLPRTPGRDFAAWL